MKKLLYLFLLLIGSKTFATDYYVSQSLGNDANTGLDADHPWKTVTKVNAQTFVSDDRILFYAGDTWRDAILTAPSSGSSGHPIVFGTYGTGASPIISASDVKTGFTIFAPNVWQVAATTQVRIAYFNGVRGNLAASAAAIAVPGDWFWASNVFYCFAPANVDPSVTYILPGVEIGVRNRPCDTNNKTDLTFTGLTFRDGNAVGFSGNVKIGATTANRITFTNCVVERGRGCGFDINGATTLDNVIIEYCTVRNNGQIGILQEKTFTSTGQYRYCTVDGNGWAVNLDNNQFSNMQGDFGNAFIHDNTISNSVPVTTSLNSQCHGIYHQTTTTNYTWIYNNTIFNCPNGAAVKTRSSAWIAYNTLYNARLEGIEMGSNSTVDETVYAIGNAIYGSVSGFPGIAELPKGAGKMSLNAYNNTFYKNGSISTEVSISDNMDTLRLKNNIFYQATGRLGVEIPTQTHTVAIDYNLYYRDDGAFSSKYSGTTQTTFASWKSVTGFDAHSVNASPLLIAPPSNLAIPGTSPAFNAGVDVGLPFVYAAPDIGYFEVSYPLKNHVTIFPRTR